MPTLASPVATVTDLRPRHADPAVVPAAASLLAEGFTPSSLLARCEPGNQLAQRIAKAMTGLQR